MSLTVTAFAKLLVALTVRVSAAASPITVLPFAVRVPVTVAEFRVARPEVLKVLRVVAPVTPRVVVTEALFSVASPEVLRVPVIAVFPAFTAARVLAPVTFSVVPAVIAAVVVTDLNVTSEPVWSKVPLIRPCTVKSPVQTVLPLICRLLLVEPAAPIIAVAAVREVPAVNEPAA